MWCIYKRSSRLPGYPAPSQRVFVEIVAGAPARRIFWKQVDINPLLTAGRNHPLPPLAPLPTPLPSMTGLAPPSNMFVTPPPPIQPRSLGYSFSLTVLGSSSSIDSLANRQFASHMSSIFAEQWATEKRVRQEQRERDSARLQNLHKINTPFWCMHESRYVISAAFAFVADPLVGSCRAHRRRISRRLRMATLCPR